MPSQVHPLPERSRVHDFRRNLTWDTGLESGSGGGDTWKRLVRTQEGGGERESAPSSIRLRPAGTQATRPPAAGLAPNAQPGSAGRAPSQPGRGSGLEPREVLEVTPGIPSPIPKLRGREWREAGESARPRAGGGVSDLNPAAAGEGRRADRREGPGRWLRGRTARPRAASPSLIRASSQPSHLECGGDPGGGRRGGAGTSAPPPASGRVRPARGSWERKVHLGREARSLNFCVLQNEEVRTGLHSGVLESGYCRVPSRQGGRARATTPEVPQGRRAAHTASEQKPEFEGITDCLSSHIQDTKSCHVCFL
ncbi:translation initiation factor IF-2-like [Mustela erminea]|uniref:translation initiation factor IF-2-like n=1 Tax=Mustela erminea TaxID=36723 RepID=UPI001386BCA3|nr:translation initiation factor IF-2-like [Mustela erminea]